MALAHIGIGVALGALGALLHLAITRWRARLVVAGRTAAAWAAYPLGLGALAAALFVAARVAPLAAWCFVGGVLAARAIVLARARRPA